MSRYVLGLSALYHDAAAALLRDGEVVAAASEERFSRLKHDASIPVRAARFCLDQAGIVMDDVEHVVYYEKPLRKFDRLIVSQLQEFPRSWNAFRHTMLTWLTDKLWLRNSLVEKLGVASDRILFCDHHLSHAASAFYSSPFPEAAVLTIDGVGEWATTTLSKGGPGGLTRLSDVVFPHSIGLVYSAFTAYLGFMVNEGEYKVMGMAAFGRPRYEEEVRRILKPQSDGSFEVDTSYLTYHHSAQESYNRRFEALFGPARFPGTPFDPKNKDDQRYADVAASIQKVTEDCVVGLACALHRQTGLDALCMAGGVALNTVANREVLRRTPFQRLFVQPAAGDAGGALGAAQWAWNEVMGGARGGALTTSGLGQEWTDGAIGQVLRDLRLPYEEVGADTLVERATQDLTSGKVLGWCQGRFEWGPRALGHRSILADPRHHETALRVNEKVKFREPFRPFAPSVAEGSEGRYFDVQPSAEHVLEWMLTVVNVTDAGRAALPATTHVDGSARAHVVREEANPLYHRLLRRFGDATGHPVLLNTSFNLKGEPMVSSPVQALASFHHSALDALYVGSFRVAKPAERSATIATTSQTKVQESLSEVSV